jgi:predicted N-acyltransferase
MHHSCLRTVVVVRWPVDALNDAGYMHRKTMAFQFQNKNNDKNGAPYTSFEDYLSVFKSKRRQKVRHLTFTGGEGSRTGHESRV